MLDTRTYKPVRFIMGHDRMYRTPKISSLFELTRSGRSFTVKLADRSQVMLEKLARLPATLGTTLYSAMEVGSGNAYCIECIGGEFRLCEVNPAELAAVS